MTIETLALQNIYSEIRDDLARLKTSEEIIEPIELLIFATIEYNKHQIKENPKAATTLIESIKMIFLDVESWDFNPHFDIKAYIESKVGGEDQLKFNITIADVRSLFVDLSQNPAKTVDQLYDITVRAIGFNNITPEIFGFLYVINFLIFTSDRIDDYTKLEVFAIYSCLTVFLKTFFPELSKLFIEMDHLDLH